MNLISNIASGLMAQNVAKNYGSVKTQDSSRVQGQTETNSFQSIFKLLDANGDDALDANELKIGLEGFVSNFILNRDLNSDQALNAEEAGLSVGNISQLDANADQLLDGGEISTEAGRIMEGLVSLLDTDGDGTLSGKELTILELLFSSLPSAVENSELNTDTIFTRSSSSAGETLELNLDTIPESMRKAGFEGSDNALYYALAHVYNYGPGAEMPDDGAGSLAILNTQRDAIYNWFDGEMAKVQNILKKNPQATVTAITNDGKDRCGFRLGAAIMERLKEFGGRVQLGSILPESEY